jgi:hypothetical protein
MKPRKSLLRIAARRALESRGFQVSDILGPGIVLGGRLLAVKGSKSRTVAVRTATDRQLGLIRDAVGKWKTIPRMDEVVVVAPAIGNSDFVDVLGFKPKILLERFDEELERLQRCNPRFSAKAPVFLRLDERRRQPQLLLPALKDDARWTLKVPLPHSVDLFGVTSAAFVDRVRAEFAHLHGVTRDEVQVEFRIIRPAPKPSPPD